jgi:hypothetical protein
MNEKQREAIVVVYAAAMAWVEAAAVVYLRTLTGRLQPFQSAPLNLSAGTRLAGTEVVREAATLIMLLSVGWLAGRSWRSRLAYAMIAFGIWDILYYVFLAIIGPWPRSIWDWDVLFLIPLPWWGPVLAPVAVSVILILSGTLVSQFDQPERPLWPRTWAQISSLLGAGLALYIFMANALQVVVLGSGRKALGDFLPPPFNWPLFAVALALLAMPILDLGRQILSRSHPPRSAIG